MARTPISPKKGPPSIGGGTIMARTPISPKKVPPSIGGGGKFQAKTPTGVRKVGVSVPAQSSKPGIPQAGIIIPKKK